jgi:hypothetical protein
MDFESELRNIKFCDDEADMEMMYDFVDRLEKLPNQRDAVPAIFGFFESYFDRDLSSPRPLVHFLEEGNDYVGELKRSIYKKPTDLTVWMVNRILNRYTGKDRAFWLAELVKIVNHPNADSEAKNQAKAFIECQREKI